MLQSDLIAFLDRGGPALWAIAALSVLTMALIFWKLWDLSRLGAWSRAPTEAAITALHKGDRTTAETLLIRHRSVRSALAHSAMTTDLPSELAREEVLRCGKQAMSTTRRGLRALELIATIAPLIGLLGTVLGMIEAFQALQAAGNRADPAALAGGIWQALLTTAAGMAVAIPASMALTGFESICDRIQLDLEDIATRMFSLRDKVA